MSFPVVTTEGFRALAKDSKGRNRRPAAKLLEVIDPEGNHVGAFSMIHNDCELRFQWYVKIKDQSEPVKVWMDNSFEAVDRWVQYPSSSRTRTVYRSETE